MGLLIGDHLAGPAFLLDGESLLLFKRAITLLANQWPSQPILGEFILLFSM